MNLAVSGQSGVHILGLDGLGFVHRVRRGDGVVRHRRGSVSVRLDAGDASGERDCAGYEGYCYQYDRYFLDSI